MSAINLIGAAVRDLLGNLPRRPAFRITAKAAQGKRGRRARRQAFYSRQRLSRLLQRIVNVQPAIDLGGPVDDLLRYGSTWIQVSEASFRRVPPSEWRAVDFPESRGEVPG